MAKHVRSDRLTREAVNQFRRLSTRNQLLLLAVGLVVLVGYLVWSNWPRPEPAPPPVAGDGKPAPALLAFWNVENFYDDEDDPKNSDDMEDWFANDRAAFHTKVDRLAEGLLKMNAGVGPDIAGLCEVESERALHALKDALNAKLDAAGRGDRRYERVVFKPDNTGRRFAPGLLTRFGVTADRTRKLGVPNRNGRILESHLHHNGHELVVIVAHWTSRVTDDADDGRRRMSYANDCYGRINEILHANPDADVLLCGDFNDEFKDPSLQVGLRAVNDPEAVRNALQEPRLLALLADWGAPKDPPGSIYSQDHGGWSVFDHICVARGLLDEQGWTCDPSSARVFAPEEFRRQVRKRFEPLRFGSPTSKGERGYSDHFPVTVQLRVAGAQNR